MVRVGVGVLECFWLQCWLGVEVGQAGGGGVWLQKTLSQGPVKKAVGEQLGNWPSWSGLTEACGRCRKW